MGKISALVLLIIFMGLIAFWLDRATKHKIPAMKRIPALDTIDEGVARAAEMGGRVIWSSGQLGSITGSRSGAILASIGIMDYIADKCIEAGVELVTVSQAPEDYAYITNLLVDKYRAAGVEELLHIDNLIFCAKEGFHISCVEALQSKKIATAFWMGQYSSSAAIVGEAASLAGCFSSCWSEDNSNVPYFVMTCDYTFLAEEGYGAAAYLSKDPTLMGSFIGIDTGRYVIMALLIIGSILSTFDINIISTLLGM